MKYCCVPLCKSTSKFSSDLSFHELPSDAGLRQKWLKAISREDSTTTQKHLKWNPGDSAVVCSNHFQLSDFESSSKRRRLRPETVPSIFPGYPSYLQPQPITRRRTLPVRRNVVPKKKRKLPKGPSDAAEENLLFPPPLTNDPQKGVLQNPHFFFEDARANYQQRIRELQSEVRKLKRVSMKRKQKLNLLELKLNSLNNHNSPYEKLVAQIDEDAQNGNLKAYWILEQINAYGKKRFRWSEETLRMCILWRRNSSRSYKFARVHLLNAPCDSTLRSYIGPSSLETGLTSLGKMRLEEEIRGLQEVEKYLSLIFDEMAIQEKLQYRKQADKVVGLAENVKNSNDARPLLANRLLCFVLKGLTTNYRIPAAYFLVRQLDSQQLHNFILDVLRQLKDIGFKVCRLVCDDAAVNAKALQNICGGQLLSKISHPVRQGDPIFISFDQCHILKNLRNQLLDDNRNLNFNGMKITAKPIKVLYETQKMLPIKPVRFLSRKVVYPTNFEKMNVKTAVQIFSTEVIAALEFCQFRKLPGFRDIGGTLEFMKAINKWFCIHNVANTTHFRLSRHADRMHFWMVDDERLAWLERNFLEYLENWKSYAENSGTTLKLSNQYFLTKQTYAAIKITTQSTVDFIRYLLSLGFHFVLTRKFSSDDVEGIFFCSPRFTSNWGNNSDRIEGVEIGSSSRKNVLNREMPAAKLVVLNLAQKRLASKLGNPPLLRDVTTKNAELAMVSGFLLRLVADRHPCSEAISHYQGCSNSPINTLVRFQDRGGLSYPSTEFVSVIALLLPILGPSKGNHKMNAVVKSWVMTFKTILPHHCLVCGCGDLDHTDQFRELVLRSITKIYMCNVSFNLTDSSNDKPKYNSKPLSSKVKKL